MNEIKRCPVCGGNSYTDYVVLWDKLITEWNLAPNEVDYINRQQGHCCKACGNNMRSLALADAILSSYGFHGTLKQFIETDNAKKLRVLEINEVGGLSPILSKLPLHKIVRYPDSDMTKLDLTSNTYDLVLHSDTLEHIPDPIDGLSECLRVLVNGGLCIFTIPIIIGRLSRSRIGMKNSYHGNPEQSDGDYIVHTEFGADMWTYVIKAGFSAARIHSFEYPAALAIEATKFIGDRINE